MANYVSSNANRFYVSLETTYGQAAPIVAGNRFPANGLDARQSIELSRRLDKTGTRTFQGNSTLARRRTAFEVKSYLSAFTGAEPAYGPLFRSALGGTPQLWPGASVAATDGSKQLQTVLPHGLAVGSAVAYSGEIRFVNAVVDATTLAINAPWTQVPQVNDVLSPTITYRLSSQLPSVTLYDYWAPSSAISRILTGAAVDQLNISVNGDVHEFVFSGPAADLIDSATLAPGQGGLSGFPAEPSILDFDSAGVPGHLGQAWIGGSDWECATLTEASIRVKNNLDLRNQEFGSLYPRAVVPGPREVSSTFSLLVQDDDQTNALYSAAKLRSTMPVMLQLGLEQGRLMGVYLPRVVPDVPKFDDSDIRLQWRFENSIAEGSADDEIYLAFA